VPLNIFRHISLSTRKDLKEIGRKTNTNFDFFENYDAQFQKHTFRTYSILCLSDIVHVEDRLSLILKAKLFRACFVKNVYVLL